MSGIPRMPRDSDPRRPRKDADDTRQPSGNAPRSYGQYAEAPKRKQDEIEEFEDLTDEPIREGDDVPTQGSKQGSRKRDRQLREFEDLAGEPVMEEDEKDDSQGN